MRIWTWVDMVDESLTDAGGTASVATVSSGLVTATVVVACGSVTAVDS